MLHFTPHYSDFSKFSELLDNSDFHAEYNKEFDCFIFEEENPIALELALNKEIIEPNNIDGYFEIEEN